MRFANSVAMLLLTSLTALAAFASTASTESTDNFKVTLGDDAVAYANLTSLSDMEERIRRKLIDELKLPESSVRELLIDRVFTSDWFMVSVEGKQYVVDQTAKNWLRSDLDGFFVFDGGVRQVAVSNKSRESLISMRLLLNSFGQLLPSYGDSSLSPIYAFIDMTCPHCRKFHLSTRERVLKAGHRIVYVPFLRDTKDPLHKKINLSVFCQGSEKKVKQALEHVFLLDSKELKKNQFLPSCTPLQSAVFGELLNAGDDYKLIGSPMFLTPSGEVIYGGPALERYLGI